MPAHGRMYTVEFNNVAVTAAQDLFELTPADDKPLRIHGWMVGQSSDAGDAQDELLRVQLIRGYTTSGSGGSTATPRPLNRSDAAAGFTCEINNTTVANTGTTHTLHSDVFNVRAGMPFWFPPESRPEVSQADTTLVLRLPGAPADSLTMSGVMYVEELG